MSSEHGFTFLHLQTAMMRDAGRPQSPLAGNGLPKSSNDSPEYPPHSIAIVGMSGRFPAADSVDELWELLLEGKSMFKPAPAERLNLPQSGSHADTKWWGNFLRDPESFDHRFFKKPSREAIAWDPQQRILLEVVYQALESAGHFGPSPTAETNDYGCYIGAVMNNYYDNMSCHPSTAYATLGTSRPFLSGAMSHHFGFTGPSLTIDTACSSSLVAINTACRAIWSGECSRAIAGGTNVISSPFDYQNLHAAGLLSPTGQCKPFDAAADGYCRGEAVSVVVLKKLSDAIKDNNNILGVIVGSAANQNHNVSHITVPHSGSQVDLYKKVMNLGNVKPESVSYVEAHGMGTSVGDPVEVRSIRDAFGGPHRDSPLYFSSIKGNIGHTEASAGISGLIKVLLMMKHGKIPKQASYSALNPKIPSFSQDKLAIPTTTLPWNPPFRLACVNSHGIAGSNSTVLLRDKPSLPTTRAAMQLSRYPLFISAGSSNSLSMYSKKLLEWLRKYKTDAAQDSLLASITFNLADRANHSLPYIFSTSVSSIEKLETSLEAALNGSGIATAGSPNPVVLVFGGQEREFIGLSREVYESSKVFRSHLDQCNQRLVTNKLESLYPIIFGSEPIENLITLHSALFAVQYASAKAWIDCGLKVDALVGHSFGQLTAFCISGALSLTDALTLVVERATLMQKYWSSEKGSMISLQADQKTVEQILTSLSTGKSGFYAEIACYNSPKNHVVVGSTSAINTLEQHIADTPHLRDSVRSKRLRVTHGFHSKFTEPLLPYLTAVAKKLVWKHPVLHLETCDDGSRDVEFDFRIVPEHTRFPVFFQQAVEKLDSKFPRITWIEAGCGSSVMQLVRDSVRDTGHTFLSPPLASDNALGSLTDMSVDLWKSGYVVQFWPFDRSEKPGYEPLSLPPYQFEKTKHWLPFVGRGPRKEVKSEVKEKIHGLIYFLGFGDASEKEATFQIDPRSDRFQAMLSGHITAGQKLAPASLYFEILARAALYLQKDTEAKDYVPTVNDLRMKSPIGCDTSAEISLVLKRKRPERSAPSWLFSITTKNGALQKGKPQEHCTGHLLLKKRDDAHAARDIKRFESLTGYRRYEAVFEHSDAERMQGNHIYRALGTVVQYGQAFHGVKKIACLGNEAAGMVRMTPDLSAPADQRLCDTPMTDSFMQFSGFLVNYFNNPNLDDVFVCGEIEHIELGGRFNPDAKEWIVYSNMSENIEGCDASSDVYVFEAESHKMVMAVFGCRFSKVPRTLLANLLKTINQPNTSSASSRKQVSQTAESTGTVEKNVPPISTEKASSKRHELLRIVSNITDVRLEKMNMDSTLNDLKIDSLMATEMLSDIRKHLGLTLDLTSFLSFPNLKALVAYVDKAFGVDTDGEVPNTPTSSSTSHSVVSPSPPPKAPKESQVATPDPSAEVDRPDIISAIDAFKETRLEFDQLAEEINATGFWSEVYPHQARLVLAYVVEAFAQIGCDLANLQPGDSVPWVKALEKNAKFVKQLYRVLEDGKLIVPTDQGFVRSDTHIDRTPAEAIYQQIIGTHPEHDNVNKLVRAVGSRMAACLTGHEDGLQLILGDKDTKAALAAMYEFWPLLRTSALLLGNFLLKALSNSTGEGKFRILEVGAGTGGTTRYIVKHLQDHGIPFEYVFTDISSSLVSAAKKQFKGVDNMSFEVLDIEKPVMAEYEGAFHCIIATNCIYATRNLETSLTHLRKMLREDGALTLIEITQNMFWLDIVVGLFKGWWSFEDDRSHALVDEQHWGRVMEKSGFKKVLWSDGTSPESKTVRVIAAFLGEDLARPQDVTKSKQPVNASVETLVYKKIGNQEIHADVYYPPEGRSSNEKMPIALMIHGGSHVLFSRKDIQPAQAHLLLEKGFLPVSLDHRLCPEINLSEGAMVDVSDALYWARHTLPHIDHGIQGLQIDGNRVVVVGWSSGGQLAMSLAWTSPQRGSRPPEAILAFYAPTNYEDEWWRQPIQPNGAVDKGYQYDVLEAIQEQPISNYGVIGAWEPLSDPRILTDARSRVVLHINWKAQTLPVILGGLPSRRSASNYPDVEDWNNLPQPSLDKIQAASALAQIRKGNYRTPTFLIHGTADDLVPWQQSRDTHAAMVERNIETDLVLIEGAPHICDLSSDRNSDGWKAVVRGYDFLSSYVF
ncbi:BcPKS19, polyketide synthase [Massarina eburnea CBS 473.64]|uniref:BcPKS19, polyketide synthase n=1 Tax=Massarina eburnea CBS 473.64 TaxID=1395130 RepID=A0A6A6SA87_9PLEO|nr:BcPKS19, polyketide synthase [Massarina eburnea CBS 473.64]